jgi:hypothetical protein
MLVIFGMKCIRRIAGYEPSDHIRNRDRTYRPTHFKIRICNIFQYAGYLTKHRRECVNSARRLHRASVGMLPTVWRYILPPFSGSKCVGWVCSCVYIDLCFERTTNERVRPGTASGQIGQWAGKFHNVKVEAAHTSETSATLSTLTVNHGESYISVGKNIFLNM